MVQPSLFEASAEPASKPASDDAVRLRVLITVKAAPNPSGVYGDGLCRRPQLGSHPPGLDTAISDQLPCPGRR